MKTILDEIKERLELVTKGEFPYCETDAEYVTMYRQQEATLAAIASETYRLRAVCNVERKSHEYGVRLSLVPSTSLLLAAARMRDLEEKAALGGAVQYREHECWKCKHKWNAPVELASPGTGCQNISGEKTVWCPKCGKRADCSSPVLHRVVEVNAKGKTHCEHAPGGSTINGCRREDMTFGGRCLNCGWVFDHTEERQCETKN